MSSAAAKRNVSVLICLFLMVSFFSLAAPGQSLTVSALASSYPLTEGFESYGTQATGYTSPMGSSVTAVQPWKNAVGASSNWSVGEESVAGATYSNHILKQTDASTSAAYVVTHDYWGSSQPEITSQSITISGKLKVTGANSTYAGLVAKYSLMNGSPAYYRLTMKKNSASYQFYLEKVTGSYKTAVPKTAGTTNASGVSISSTTLNPYFDSLGYMPVQLNVIHNIDGSLTLEGYYGSTLVLSGTDTTPYATGQVGLYSNAGTTAFDDVQVALSNASGNPVTAPAVTGAAAGSGEAQLSWSVVTGLHYDVKRQAPGESAYTTIAADAATNAAAGPFTYTVTGLTNGTAYSFIVTARSNDGQSADSAPVTVTPQQPSPQIVVHNSTELGSALSAANPGDTILLDDGNYAGLTVTGRNGTAAQPIVVKAKNKGMAKFNSSGLLLKNSSYITLQDIEFAMTSAGNWVRLTGSHHIRITNNYFHSPSTTSVSGSSIWIFIDGSGSHDNRVDHNLMENKLDRGKFIVFDGISSGTGPYEITQHDMVEYNIFRNTVSRQTNESESIRVGVSTLISLDAYATIQYNIFDHCDADPEIVSIKSGSNTVRYNYFIESLGSLSLRAGNSSSAYGNIFIGNGRTAPNPTAGGEPLGTGGIRVYGENHKVFNNYFEGLTGTVWDAPLTFTTGDKDDMLNHLDTPGAHFIAKNVTVANNTLINNTSGIELGYDRYGIPPENLTFANNIVVGSQHELIKIMHAPVGVQWTGNMMYPQQGIPLITGNSVPLTASEVQVVFPNMKNEVLQLSPQDYGWLWTSSSYERLRTIPYKKLSTVSPAINASLGDYGTSGAYGFVTLDMEREQRTGTPDVGADEYIPAAVNDASAPVWPAGQSLSQASVAPREARLQWLPPSDDTEVVAYRIYRNSVLLDTVFGDELSYTARALEPGETYVFQVEALDQGNHTSRSHTLSLSTPGYTGITLSGLPAQIALGGTPKQLEVTLQFADQSTEAVTTGAVFASSNPNAVSVSPTGWAVAEGLGSASLTASYLGMTSAPLAVTVYPSSQQTQIVDADTYVDNIISANADTNYNNATEMLVKYSGGRRDGYLQSSLPVLSGTVDTVQLRVYVGSVETGSDLQLYGIIDDSWNPATITANNQPEKAVTDVYLGQVTAIADNSYVTFDVTKFFNSQSDSTLSFRLTMATADNMVHVKTREGTDINQAPTLIFTVIHP
ncbi:chondroitinase-B domain-containing protein [Paenibacillus rigui]|uniref:Fibronectin type-III domain-containing protein n=1 Tax=Paenibacillus rigui TaxID=554312 RepID=A0A229UZE5_9BACL|nr:chondroitinase-B domain-containing protein [Paenibacillus rigui]OXM88339.1 hypothetical protein CF651_00280 [Paenibacillus rigui]